MAAVEEGGGGVGRAGGEGRQSHNLQYSRFTVLGWAWDGPGNEATMGTRITMQGRVLALQYNTLKTHQFLLGTVSLVAAFHCTHSPTHNGSALDHQNIRFNNYTKLHVTDEQGT